MRLVLPFNLQERSVCRYEELLMYEQKIDRSTSYQLDYQDGEEKREKQHRKLNRLHSISRSS